MTKVDDYRKVLATLDDWGPFLLRESGLPGPRGNLELAATVAELGDPAQFERWLALDLQHAPENSAEVFLVFCAVYGQGRLLAAGQRERLDVLRRFAADPRWRVREAVAMALQRWGDSHMPDLLAAMAGWSSGSPWEQRAAAAGLCEPRLLVDPRHAAAVLHILDAITMSMVVAAQRKDEAYRVLRQAMGYCWSVAVVALSEQGKATMERWCASSDPDVRWMMRENLGKKRLQRMDAAWTALQLARLNRTTT